MKTQLTAKVDCSGVRNSNVCPSVLENRFENISEKVQTKNIETESVNNSATESQKMNEDRISVPSPTNMEVKQAATPIDCTLTKPPEELEKPIELSKLLSQSQSMTVRKSSRT